MKIIAVFAFGLTFTGILSTAPAQAQATRTFVSPTGSDAAACSLAAPCRTFAAAFALTNAGGEIAVLGSAGYGPLTISNAISIVNGGGFEAAIAVPSGGTGITINAGTNDAVSLRGLSIEGAGVGQTGIQFNSGASLTVENCVIRHVTGDGIDFLPNVSSSFSVSNTGVADNGANGIAVAPTGSGTVSIMFNRVEVKNNASDGLAMLGINNNATISGTVTDSVFFRNNGVGIELNNCGAPAQCLVGIQKNLAIVNSRIVSNGVGIQSFGLLIFIYLSKSNVQWNATTCVNGPHVWSYGDNNISGVGCNPPPLVSLN